MDETPTGNGRAITFEFEPIVRMTSTYIENGTDSLAELYKMAEGGIFIDSYRYGTGSSLFSIAPKRAFRVRDGKLAEPVRVNVISGNVFETLLNIEAIANDYHLLHSALGGCGKMQQMPLPVSDGGPTILVKDMQVS
ncbi:protease TldD [compost metagenome]